MKEGSQGCICAAMAIVTRVAYGEQGSESKKGQLHVPRLLAGLNGIVLAEWVTQRF